MKNQISIQLTSDEVDLLEAAVFLRRLKSAQDLVRPLVRKLLSELEAEPEIVAVIAQRAKPPIGEGDDKVRSLSPRRRQTAKQVSGPKS